MPATLYLRVVTASRVAEPRRGEQPGHGRAGGRGAGGAGRGGQPPVRLQGSAALRHQSKLLISS